MANGTYNNPRAGSNGSKGRMKNLTDKVNKDYTPWAEQWEGKPGRKQISQKKYLRKAKQASKGKGDLSIMQDGSITLHRKNKDFVVRQNIDNPNERQYYKIKK